MLNILYIIAHNPFSESYGSQLRTLQIGRLLQRIGNVSIVCASLRDLPESIIKRTKEEFDLKAILKIKPDPIDNFNKRIRHEFEPTYLNTHGLRIDDQDSEMISKMIGQYDVIWVHTLRLANIIRIWRFEKSIIDVDDLYSQYHKTVALQSTNIFKKFVSLRRAWLWRRREQDLLNRFDLAAVCSENDRLVLGKSSRVHVLPNGYYGLTNKNNYEVSFSRLGFIGVLEYPPNKEGVKWFLDNVWPLIKKRVSGAEFRIVGKGGCEDWGKIKGVHVLGYVDDANDEIGSWTAMVVPILIGAGTRVKIAEAFARRCPVVSTTLGAYGYDVESGRELFLADSPQHFAAACEKLLKSENERNKLIEAGYLYFKKYLHWDSLYPKVLSIVQQVKKFEN